MLLKITTGNCSFQAGGARLLAFVLQTNNNGNVSRTLLTPTNFKEAKVSSKSIPAGQGSDQFGTWFDCTYAFQTNVLLSLELRETGTSAWGVRDLNKIIRLRDGAALRRMSVPVPASGGATRTSLTVEGRFDVLSPDEISRLFPGKVIADNYATLSIRWGATVPVTVLQPEKDKYAETRIRTLVTRDGNEIKVQDKNRRLVRRPSLPRKF